MANALSVYGFPNSYNDLVTAAATVKYISATGSNSNDGNTASTPYLTIAYAQSQTSAISTLVTYVVLPGTYTLTATSNTSDSSSFGLYDNNLPRRWICSPANTIIQFTATGADRDAPLVGFQNANTAVYGAILKRNNNARTTNYTVALFKGFGYANGKMYNCVIQETNANGAWSLQYDNNNVSTLELRNCTFYLGASSGDYSGSSGLKVIDSTFKTTYTSTSATMTNDLQNQTIDATTYVTNGVTTQGVYSGAYAWNGAMTVSPITVSSSTGASIVSAGQYKIYTFASSGSITFSSTGSIECLVVAGGGGGVGEYPGNAVGSGGGGAGGLVYAASQPIAAQTYNIVIGAGAAKRGQDGYSVGGYNGSDSTVGSNIIVAKGGGGGGHYSVGVAGGSGGGGGYNGAAAGATTQNTIGVNGTGTGYGFAGGVGSSTAGQGGGGGAGAIGNSGSSVGGNGGTGRSYDITGTATYYAGGGGGAGGYSSGSLGGLAGLGGGGAGGTSATAAGSGTSNTGGGGGGSPNTIAAGAGGSGVVILKVYVGWPSTPGLYALDSAASGSSIDVTLVTSEVADGSTVAYNITGVTSAQLNNFALTGNFTVTKNAATITIPTSSTISSATITISASTFSKSIAIAYPTTISTANITNVTIGTSSSSYTALPIFGQMNISKTVIALALPEWNSSPSPVGTPTQNKTSALIIPTLTLTTSTAGVLNMYSIKPFGDSPQREYWF